MKILRGKSTDHIPGSSCLWKDSSAGRWKHTQIQAAKNS
jgi:hypothetical protein